MQAKLPSALFLTVFLIWVTAVTYSRGDVECPESAGYWTCHDGIEEIHSCWKCDGAQDCDDGSDESDSECVTTSRRRRSTDNTPFKPLSPFLRCNPNYERCPGEELCIPLSKFCDKHKDCELGGDETSCNVTFSTSCDKLNCAYKCTQTKDGPKCYCDSSLFMMSKENKCVNYNPCDYHEGICDQKCSYNSSSRQFSCSCTDNYGKDGTHCIPLNEPKTEKTYLLVAASEVLLQLNLTSDPPTLSHSSNEAHYIRTVDFDHRKKLVCWIMYEPPPIAKSTMKCMNQSTTSNVIEIFTQVTLETIENFAYDWITGNWYFVDVVNDRIILCTFEGENCATILKFEDETPQTLVLEPNLGLMFYTLRSKSKGWSINQAHLDGTKSSALVEGIDELINPYGMTIDYPNKQLYWVDSAKGTVERININGETVKRYTVTRLEARKSRGISILGNFIYVTGDDVKLTRIHRWDRSVKVTKYMNIRMHDSYQLQIYHRLRQPINPDVNITQCEALGCKHLCVNVPSEDGLVAKCLCEAGYQLANDLKDCTMTPECSRCKNGQCGDTDKKDCQISSSCEEGYRRCPLNECLMANWWCDREPDCKDGADELFCHIRERTCDEMTEFTCVSSRECIDREFQCNAVEDCKDGSDELGCDVHCGEDKKFHFECDSKTKCLFNASICDGKPDCLDGTDEKNCGKNCLSNEFRCGSGECINKRWKCDQESDCLDGSDETACWHQKNCSEHEFKCEIDGSCILKSWQCDREYDCKDRSDEANCTYHTCNYPNVTCGNNENTKCITPNQMCDNNTDCPDNRDEKGCKSETESCRNHSCSDICHPAPPDLVRHPYICLCQQDRELGSDNRTCNPSNICQTWGICGQKCEKSQRGHVCSCNKGYHLESDGFTCRPLDNVPVYVIFSNRHEMRSVDLTNHNYAALVSGLHNTVALDFYYAQQYIFWTDVADDKIFRGKLQGNALTDITPIVDIGLATTEGLAIDWIGEKIYWVESKLYQIEVAGINGENRTTLIAGNMVSPRAIVLDPRVGTLFWTDWDTNSPRIETCSMAGEDRHVIFHIRRIVEGGWPNGLTIDYDFKRLYWIDARSDSIHTVTYEGHDHRQVLQDRDNIRHPFALTLFGNHVYWTDWGINALVSANKFDGSNVTIVKRTNTQPFDIQVYHPKRQLSSPNPCAVNNGNCSHLCLISYNNTVGCVCPHLMELAADGKTCKPDQSFLVFVRRNEIRGVDLENANFSVIPTLTTPYVNKPIAVDYDVSDEKEGHLYWADQELKVINKSPLSGSEVKTVIDSGRALTLDGFVVDWISKNMYFSTYNDKIKRGTITVANLDGAYRKEIFVKNSTKVNSITVSPISGKLYFSVFNEDNIYGAKMDGSDVKAEITDANRPTNLKYSEADGRIYFLSERNNSIIACEILSSLKCENIYNSSSNQSEIQYTMAFAVNGQKGIFIAHDHKIAKLSKGEQGYSYSILRDKTDDVIAMAVYDKSQRVNDTNACRTNNGDCSQLCLPVGKNKRVCVCTAGYQRKNETYCVGIDSLIIYSAVSEIRGITYDPQNSTEALPFISQIQKATAIDFHAAQDYIYWVETSPNYQIARIKRDLTGYEVIISDEIGRITDIAVDWIAGHLYWTDSQRKVIELVQLKKASSDEELRRYVVIHDGLQNPQNIVLNPKEGTMIWMDSISMTIEQASLDGTDRRILMNLTTSNISGLSLDHTNRKKLYWCDRQNRIIVRLNLDTREKITVAKSVDCYSLTVFKTKMYWINVPPSSDASILSLSKEGSSSPSTLIKSKLPKTLNSIKVFDRLVQAGNNSCTDKNGGCEEICLFNSKKMVTCACTYGKLDTDKKKCIDHDSYLLFSKVTAIQSLHMTGNKNKPTEEISDKILIRNVIALTADYSQSRVFFSDIQQSNIQSVWMDGSSFSNITTVIPSIGSVEGLAYDSSNNTLYWTSYTNSSINRVKINPETGNASGPPQKLIQLSTSDHPRAIVVDSCTQHMFWTNWHSSQPGIQRAFFSGYSAQYIIKTDISTPNGLAIDHKEQLLYWIDARLDKIERCDFDGNNRVVVMTSIPQHPFGLALYGDHLYWTDWLLHAVVRVNKYDSNDYAFLSKNLNRQPMGITVFAKDANDCTQNPCLNAGCSQKCKVVKGNAVCYCNDSYFLLNDGVRCIKNETIDNCGVTDFLCHDAEKCIKITQTCDKIPHCLDESDESAVVCNKEHCHSQYFTCNNYQCIPFGKQCDGKFDCLDGSDERDCQCNPDTEFQCRNKQCINRKYHCDMDIDCDDNSDEIGCDFNCSAIHHEDTAHWVSCNTTSLCIMESWICDGKRDCPDSEDEKNCSNTKGDCKGPDMFLCKDGNRCIPSAWKCDLDNDCLDKSDELTCDDDCDSSMTKCSEGTCIPKSWECDGHPDCFNGTDESIDVCNVNRTCKPDEFLCFSTFRCISKDWLCDGDADCPNSEDEDVANGCEPLACSDDEFQCQNGKCVKKIFYCDSDNDCLDNSDEPPFCSKGCAVGEFQCQQHHNCINRTLLCNGFPDCYDHSDENTPNCPQKPVECDFLCDNNKCLNDSLVCNGQNDCGDNSDEAPNCNFDECKFMEEAKRHGIQTNSPYFKICHHNCTEMKIGYKCTCHPGYELEDNEHHCKDVDECKTVYPCSHFCVNTIGSYHCRCAEGFKLAEDLKTCRVTGSVKPYLILANGFYIRNISFTGSQKLILHNLNNAVAIDFDYVDQMIYWSEITATMSKISRLNTTDHKVTVIHNTTLRNPDGIAVDWVGRNIYWCDKTKDTIEVSRLNGWYRKVLIDKELQEPRALEVFPAKGLMFYTDWGNEAHISSAHMDGTNVKRIIHRDLSWPNALTIDYVTEKIFWADANLDYIAMADLDGSNRHVVIDSNVPHVFDMTTFMDHLFWTDWERMKIETAHKFSGSDRKPVATVIHRPMGIHVFHQMKQTAKGANPCYKNGGCEHLCLLKPSRLGLTKVCACPENHYLASDNRSCIMNCTSSQFYCKRSSKCIPFWWKCDGVNDCEDGSDEPRDCDEYPCSVPGEFKCAHSGSKDAKDCVNPVEICDGTPQCDNGWDEDQFVCQNFTCLPGFTKCVNESKCIPSPDLCEMPSCNPELHSVKCTNQKCDSNMFRCANGQCISYVWWCDGDQDCHDGSDEAVNCTLEDCKAGFVKCNETGRCYPESWQCDGDADCGPDGSDESPDVCDRKCDNETQWQCESGQCISKVWRCDFDKDCHDGSDEKYCKGDDYRNCSEAEFRCANRRCIHKSYRCDGEYNCEDSSDEANCNMTHACNPETEFSCNNLCIQKSWHCDGEIDCPGGEDEINCSIEKCDGGFKCGTGACVPYSWQCDGENDCSDGSDEESLHCKNFSCGEDRFKCHTHICIFANQRCDGIDNCGDGSDERWCKHERCSLDEFMCRNTSECIPMSKVCDRKNDCFVKDDESPTLCQSERHCSTNPCQHLCSYYPSLDKYKCTCKQGFALQDDGFSCVEIDQCKSWGICPQQCKVVKQYDVQRPACSCDVNFMSGYLMGTNIRTCYAKGPKPDILLAHETEIIRAGVGKGGGEKPLSVNEHSQEKILSMDIDATDTNGELILFTLQTSPKNRSTLYRYEINKLSRRKRQIPTKVISELAEPHGLAVDWVGKNIYWTDAQIHKIQMATYSGGKKRTVVTNLHQPHSIAVNPELGKIYWTDRGYPPKIESANLDGSGRKVLVKDNMIWPNGITVDYPNSRIYWVDSKKQTIETADMEGKDRHVVRQFNKTAKDPPYMLDVFEDFLYVTFYKSHNVTLIHKFNNSFVKDRVMFKNLKYVGDIVVTHPSKQKQIQNNCASSPCKRGWCINMPLSIGAKFKCVCNDDSHYNEDQGECVFYKDCVNGNRNPTTKQCVCPLRFTGALCEHDLCKDHPCELNKECFVDQNKNIGCRCRDGYIGKRCENLCSEYCKNGGNCTTDSKGNTACSCPENYTGEQCLTEVCDNQCQNGGKCVLDRFHYKKCNCTNGFTGAHCEHKPSSPCANYCKNGGKCKLSDNNLQGSSPLCDCLLGYNGQTCERSVCDNWKCGSEGTCVIDAEGNAKCNCTIFYSGSRCDNCTCLNGGKCLEKNGKTSCSCPLTFTGQLCEHKAEERPMSQSSDSTGIVIGVVVAIILIIAVILIIIVIIVKRKRPRKPKSRNPFKHQRMNGMDVPNPMYRERESDEEGREMNPHFLQEHENFANPMYDHRLYQAESTDVLLPKESDQENNIIEGNGNLRIYRKKDKNKGKGGKK